MHSHSDARATTTGSWKGKIRECTPHSMPIRCHTAETSSRQRMIDQAGRVPSTSLYRNPFLPEPSNKILPEPSKNLENLPDNSRLIQILPDFSSEQRSSPNGLTGTCAGGDSPYAAVLAQRLIGTCTGSVHAAILSQIESGIGRHWFGDTHWTSPENSVSSVGSPKVHDPSLATGSKSWGLVILQLHVYTTDVMADAIELRLSLFPSTVSLTLSNAQVGLLFSRVPLTRVIGDRSLIKL